MTQALTYFNDCWLSKDFELSNMGKRHSIVMLLVKSIVKEIFKDKNIY